MPLIEYEISQTLVDEKWSRKDICSIGVYQSDLKLCRQEACWSVMASQLSRFDEFQARRDFVPWPPQNTEEVFRINTLACPLASTDTHVPICPPTRDHAYIQSHVNMWLCDIGTDIKELVEKVKSCWKWNLCWWWHLAPSVSCGYNKRWEGLISTTQRDRYKTRVSTDYL